MNSLRSTQDSKSITFHKWKTFLAFFATSYRGFSHLLDLGSPNTKDFFILFRMRISTSKKNNKFVDTPDTLSIVPAQIIVILLDFFYGPSRGGGSHVFWICNLERDDEQNYLNNPSQRDLAVGALNPPI